MHSWEEILLNPIVLKKIHRWHDKANVSGHTTDSMLFYLAGRIQLFYKIRGRGLGTTVLPWQPKQKRFSICLVMEYLCPKLHWVWLNNNWAMLSFLLSKDTYQSSDVTLCWTTWQLKEIVYYCKRPIHLFFHALWIEQ